MTAEVIPFTRTPLVRTGDITEKIIWMNEMIVSYPWLTYGTNLRVNDGPKAVDARRIYDKTVVRYPFLEGEGLAKQFMFEYKYYTSTGEEIT